MPKASEDPKKRPSAAVELIATDSKKIAPQDSKKQASPGGDYQKYMDYSKYMSQGSNKDSKDNGSQGGDYQQYMDYSKYMPKDGADEKSAVRPAGKPHRKFDA